MNGYVNWSDKFSALSAIECNYDNLNKTQCEYKNIFLTIVIVHLN